MKINSLKRKHILACLLILLVIGISLIVLEISARIIEYLEIQKSFYLRDSRQNLVYDQSKLIFSSSKIKELGFQLRPNLNLRLQSLTTKAGEMVLVTNDMGLREDKNIPFEKPTDTLRIIGLGDSVMFGSSVGNNETMLKWMEKEAKLKGINLQTINYSVPDSNPGYAFYNFKFQKAAEFHPDILIYGFCLNDFDITCNKIDERTGVVYVSQCYNPDDSLQLKFKKFLLSHVTFCRVIIKPLVKYFKDYFSPKKITVFDQYDSSDVENSCGFYYGCRPEECESNKDRVKVWIKKLAETFDRQNIKFLLVIYPHRDQLRCALKHKDVSYHQQLTVMQICDELNIKCYDATQDLLQEIQKNNYDIDNVFWDQVHPYKIGHQILGRLMFNYLNDRLHWIPLSKKGDLNDNRR